MNTSLKNTFDSGTDNLADGLLVYDAAGETISENYSNDIKNVSHNHRAGVNLSYQLKKFRAQDRKSVV